MLPPFLLLVLFGLTISGSESAGCMAVSTVVQECSEQALAEGRGQVFYLRIKDKYIYMAN